MTLEDISGTEKQGVFAPAVKVVEKVDQMDTYSAARWAGKMVALKVVSMVDYSAVSSAAWMADLMDTYWVVQSVAHSVAW